MSTLKSNYSNSSPNGTYYSAPWDDRSAWTNIVPPLHDMQQLQVNGQQGRDWLTEHEMFIIIMNYAKYGSNWSVTLNYGSHF